MKQEKITPPTRKDIAEWSWASSRDLPAQMVQNAWRHGQYSYFPPPPGHAAATVANNTEEEESSNNNEDCSYSDESTEDNESGDDDDHEVGQSAEPLLSLRHHVNDKNNHEEDIDIIISVLMGVRRRESALRGKEARQATLTAKSRQQGSQY